MDQMSGRHCFRTATQIASKMNPRYAFAEVSQNLHLIKPRSSTSPKKTARIQEIGLADANSLM